MITIADGRMTITKQGRVVFIMLLNDSTYYHALVAYGARESVAMAAAAGLITVSTKGK